jgi:hypothetical protein
MVLFADGALSADPLYDVTGIKNDGDPLGNRELFVLYRMAWRTPRAASPATGTGRQAT